MEINNTFTSNAGYNLINPGYDTNAGHTIKIASAKKEVALIKSTPVACTTTTSTISCTNQNLSANALSGSNGLLSLSLIQWTALLLLVLTIITLWKRAFPNKNENIENHLNLTPQV